MLFSVLVSSIIIAYILLVISLWIGWERIDPTGINESYFPKITVVVAVRNEANNIAELIADIQKQDYSTDKLELIVVDDHSTDNTLSIVEKLAESAMIPIRVLSLEEESGKKAAIRYGIARAEGEIILTTDGDCRISSTWAKTMVQPFQDKKITIVSGPVNIGPQTSFFTRIQGVEFSSLISSGAATIAFGFPTMANAANMAIRKSVYLKLEGQIGSARSSGDDIFMLHEVAIEYKNSVVFCKSNNASVITAPANNLGDFYNQRKRWAGKWTSYKSVPTVGLALLVFLVNLTILISPFLALLKLLTWLMVANLFVAKTLFEFWYLKDVQKFFNNRLMLGEFIILALIYPFYVTFTAVAGTITGYQWKGRNTK